MGHGTPAVILDAGLGGGALEWTLQREIAAFSRVCSYDRGGMGYSDGGPMPRTSARLATELAALLTAARIPDPVIVVGASFGGFTARLFATRHPERTAGVLLLDATHEDQHHEDPPLARVIPLAASLGVLRLMGATLGPGPDEMPSAVRPYARATAFRSSRFHAMASEATNFPESAAEVKAARRVLSTPLLVLTGGRGLKDPWRALQADLTQTSSRGCQVIADQSGHRIVDAQPGLVVSAVRALVAASQQPTGTPCDLLAR